MGANVRVELWPHILDDQIVAVQDTPFTWGTFDCSMFAADVVLAMTGVDYAVGFRGQYKSKRGSLSRIKTLGYQDLDDVLTQRIGKPLKSVNFLQRGDLVLFDGGNGLAAGICLGAKSVGAGDVGLVSVDTSTCIKGWKI